MAEIKNDNELIAEFMGLRFEPGKPAPENVPSFYRLTTGDHIDVIEIQNYSKSWDWLMPVVEKIDSLPEIDFEMYPAYKSIGQRAGVGVKIRTSPGEILVLPEGRSRIEVVYKAVVLFIKWYNEYRKP